MNVFDARREAEALGMVVHTVIVDTTVGTDRRKLRLRFRNTLQPAAGFPMEEFRRWAGELFEPSGLEMEPGDYAR